MIMSGLYRNAIESVEKLPISSINPLGSNGENITMRQSSDRINQWFLR